MAKVGGQDVRIMIDTGANSSSVCSHIIPELSLKPKRREQRCIKQMYGTMMKNVDIYFIHIESTTVPGFCLDDECIYGEKGILTLLSLCDEGCSSKFLQENQSLAQTQIKTLGGVYDVRMDVVRANSIRQAVGQEIFSNLASRSLRSYAC